MSMNDLQLDGFEERLERVEGRWNVRVTSYKIGPRFAAKVDNVNPGAIIGRAHAETRVGAERAALEMAHTRLRTTHQLAEGRKRLDEARNAVREMADGWNQQE